MSMPTIPDIDLSSEQGTALIMASIGMQELGLSHIANAEGEKIQSFLGTLEGQTINTDIVLEDLIALDKSVTDTLESIAKNELLLLLKLDEAKKLLELPEAETINFVAQKVWDDDSNASGDRPSTLEIYLYRNNELYRTKTISDTTTGDTNTVVFSYLPKYDNSGNEYVYTIDEQDISASYTKVISDNVITNTLNETP